MDRQFFPFGGFHPFFFPRRRFFPFFFLSPFFFPFFRGEDDRDGMYYAQHQCKDGESMGTLAQMYNCPRQILEAVNPHIPNPDALMPGSTVYIPRLDRMYCQKVYFEQEVPESAVSPYASWAPNMQPYTAASPYTGGMYSK